MRFEEASSGFEFVEFDFIGKGKRILLEVFVY